GVEEGGVALNDGGGATRTHDFEVDALRALFDSDDCTLARAVREDGELRLLHRDAQATQEYGGGIAEHCGGKRRECGIVRVHPHGNSTPGVGLLEDQHPFACVNVGVGLDEDRVCLRAGLL